MWRSPVTSGVTFLDKLYDQATEQLVLLGTIERADGGFKKKIATEVRAVNVSESVDNGDSADDIELRKKKDKRKKVK